MQAWNTLVSLRICADLPEHSLLDHTRTISTKIAGAGTFVFRYFPVQTSLSSRHLFFTGMLLISGTIILQ